MTLVLATAWKPRGELARFRKLLPVLNEDCLAIAVSLPPGTDPGLVQNLKSGRQILTTVTADWAHGRYEAMRLALETSASHILYVDFDRLLRWAEKQPDEWRQIARLVEGEDCVVIGRTPQAYATHPRSLVETEAISNEVVSYLVGQTMDVSAGCKGFSRRAAEFLLVNSVPGRALGTDGEWPVLLRRAGYVIKYKTVDGLDWESADRYQEEAADILRQRRQAEAYDQDARHWQRRVEVAAEIVTCALEAFQKNIDLSNHGVKK